MPRTERAAESSRHLWIVFASLVRMPGSVLPDLSGIPWWTAALAVGVGALISPVCEQAGIWGYWQGSLEREVSPFAAVVVTSLIFGLAPHPPAQALLGPKVMFFSLTGLTFSVMAYLTNSILPAIPVHGLGLLAFFTLVWPYDPERRLVGDVGTDVWFWIHLVQIAVFAGLACWAFGRLARVTRQEGWIASEATTEARVGFSMGAHESPAEDDEGQKVVRAVGENGSPELKAIQPGR